MYVRIWLNMVYVAYIWSEYAHVCRDDRVRIPVAKKKICHLLAIRNSKSLPGVCPQSELNIFVNTHTRMWVCIYMHFSPGRRVIACSDGKKLFLTDAPWVKRRMAERLLAIAVASVMYLRFGGHGFKNTLQRLKNSWHFPATITRMNIFLHLTWCIYVYTYYVGMHALDTYRWLSARKT